MRRILRNLEENLASEKGRILRSLKIILLDPDPAAMVATSSICIQSPSASSGRRGPLGRRANRMDSLSHAEYSPMAEICFVPSVNERPCKDYT